MKELNDIEGIIIRSFDGTATENELLVLKEWLKESSDNKAQYFTLKDTWDTGLSFNNQYAGKAWSEFVRKIGYKKKVKTLLFEIGKIAAVAALVLAVSYFYTNHTTQESQAEQLAKVSVPNGSQSTVTLPDGSLVKLNAGSELIYPTSFNKEKRQVTLIGEGYFDVNHNPEHPFIVSIDDIEVKVLGTQFNVMGYADLDRIETTLISGKVVLNQKNQETSDGIVLQPGQKAIYEKGAISVQRVDISQATAWTRQGFDFKNTAFIELVKRLERWYGVEIIIEEEDFKDIKFTGKFRNSETIWQVLDAVKMVTPIKYKSRETKIYITLIK